jgi:hypothetical protein
MQCRPSDATSRIENSPSLHIPEECNHSPVLFAPREQRLIVAEVGKLVAASASVFALDEPVKVDGVCPMSLS